MLLLSLQDKKVSYFALKNDLEKKYHNQVYVYPKDLSEKDAAYDVFNYVIEQKLVIDALVNNAGFGDYGDFAESDWTRQYEMVQTNIVATMQLCRCFLSVMLDRGRGKILNLSSIAVFCAGPRMSIYYASKGFIRCFSEAIAEEVKVTGVTVTALCPGSTATGFEKAADMKNSKMFSFKPAKVSDVARAGYYAMQHGKVLKYHGLPTKIGNIGSRIVSRKVSRRFAMKING